jgi:hypothetical protein
MKAFPAACALLLALAACRDGGKETAGQAAGEILPASVSDAMLPLDTIRSQAPLAPRTGEPSRAGASSPKSGSGGAAPTPEPSESPTDLPQATPAEE